MTKKVLSHMFNDYLENFFCEELIHVFCQFFYCDIRPFFYWFVGIPYIFWRENLWGCIYYKHFLPAQGWLFLFVDSVFWWKKVAIL